MTPPVECGRRHLQTFWPAGVPTRIDSGGAGDGSPRVDRDDLLGGTAASRPIAMACRSPPPGTYLRGGLLRGQAGRDRTGQPPSGATLYGTADESSAQTVTVHVMHGTRTTRQSLPSTANEAGPARAKLPADRLAIALPPGPTQRLRPAVAKRPASAPSRSAPPARASCSRAPPWGRSSFFLSRRVHLMALSRLHRPAEEVPAAVAVGPSRRTFDAGSTGRSYGSQFSAPRSLSRSASIPARSRWRTSTTTASRISRSSTRDRFLPPRAA